MPTGYTAGILDGTINSFEDFAKKCIRNFGAAIHMRDEPSDKEYEERKPSDYHLKNLEKAKKVLSEVDNIPDATIIAEKKEQLTKDKKRSEDRIKKSLEDLHKLNMYVVKAKSFTPPTPEHQNYKDFLVQQLESTIDFDCGTEYYTKSLQQIDSQLQSLDAESIRTEIREKARRDIEYHTKHYQEDLKRCEDSNKWVQDLLNELNKSGNK